MTKILQEGQPYFTMLVVTEPGQAPGADPIVSGPTLEIFAVDENGTSQGDDKAYWSLDITNPSSDGIQFEVNGIVPAARNGWQFTPIVSATFTDTGNTFLRTLEDIQVGPVAAVDPNVSNTTLSQNQQAILNSPNQPMIIVTGDAMVRNSANNAQVAVAGNYSPSGVVSVANSVSYQQYIGSNGVKLYLNSGGSAIFSTAQTTSNFTGPAVGSKGLATILGTSVSGSWIASGTNTSGSITSIQLAANPASIGPGQGDPAIAMAVGSTGNTSTTIPAGVNGGLLIASTESDSATVYVSDLGDGTGVLFAFSINGDRTLISDTSIRADAAAAIAAAFPNAPQVDLVSAPNQQAIGAIQGPLLQFLGQCISVVGSATVFYAGENQSLAGIYAPSISSLSVPVNGATSFRSLTNPFVQLIIDATGKARFYAGSSLNTSYFQGPATTGTWAGTVYGNNVSSEWAAGGTGATGTITSILPVAIPATDAGGNAVATLANQESQGVEALASSAQVAAVPGAVDTQLSSTHGSGAWGAGSGSGAIPYEFQVLFTTGQPIYNCAVSVFLDEALTMPVPGTGVLLTSQAGIVTFNLDAGNYWFFQSLTNVTFSPNPIEKTVG